MTGRDSNGRDERRRRAGRVSGVRRESRQDVRADVRGYEEPDTSTKAQACSVARREATATPGHCLARSLVKPDIATAAYSAVIHDVGRSIN